MPHPFHCLSSRVSHTQFSNSGPPVPCDFHVPPGTVFLLCQQYYLEVAEEVELSCFSDEIDNSTVMPDGSEPP